MKSGSRGLLRITLGLIAVAVLGTSGAPGGWSVTATADSTYDWKDDQWTIPLGVFGNKVTKIGGQTVQFGLGPRYYVDSGSGGPHDWGFRAVVVLLFPK